MEKGSEEHIAGFVFTAVHRNLPNCELHWWIVRKAGMGYKDIMEDSARTTIRIHSSCIPCFSPARTHRALSPEP